MAGPRKIAAVALAKTGVLGQNPRMRGERIRFRGQWLSLAMSAGLVTLAIAPTVPRSLQGAAPMGGWLVGTELEAHLAQPVDVSWSEAELRPALYRFSNKHRLGLVVDRRVAADRPVELTLDDVPLGEAIDRIASQAGLGMSRLGPVCYVGPLPAAQRLRTLSVLAARDFGKLPQDERSRWNHVQPASWEDFAEPRQLVEGWVASAGVSLGRTDLIPHDLWHGVDLPPLPLADRLCLVLNQFDLRLIVDSAGGARLATLPNRLWIERAYQTGPDSTGKRLEKAIEDLRADRGDEIDVKHDGSRLVIRGLIEDHERLATSQATPRAPPDKRKSKKAAAKDTFFTLDVKNKPARAVLSLLESQLGLSVKLNEDLLQSQGYDLDSLVSFRVADATETDLVETALAACGLRFRRNGRQVVIEGPAAAEKR